MGKRSLIMMFDEDFNSTFEKTYIWQPVETLKNVNKPAFSTRKAGLFTFSNFFNNRQMHVFSNMELKSISNIIIWEHLPMCVRKNNFDD